MAESDLSVRIRKTLTREVVFAFALGVVIGLVVLGWWLWPIKWTDADPADLRASQKATYLQVIADSFALTGDSETARARVQLLQAAGQDEAGLAAELAALVKARLQAGRADEALRLQGLASAVALAPALTPLPTSVQPSSATGSPVQRALGVAFFLVLLGAGVLLLLTQLQKREALRRRRVPTTGRQSPADREAELRQAASPSGSTLEHFETAYTLNDREYDVSTSVQSPSGDFIGECGVSAIEEARLDDLEGISGFEIWLFDKDDVRTETKVLLSEAAFADATLREQLAHKGDVLRAQQGQVLSLETANLHLDATITDLEYADANEAAFAKLTTRLEVYPS